MLKDYSDMERNINKQLSKFGNVQSLMQYFTERNLYKIHEKQNRNKATGIDKISKDEYGMNIVNNLKNLVQEMKKSQIQTKSS